MNVKLIKYPTDEEWILCKKSALVTVDKDSEKPPTEEWKRRILASVHSPIRVLGFYFWMEDIPYYVSTHIARHVHLTPYIRSQRNDRQNEYDRNKAPQDAPVRMALWINAEELMTVAHKRLCMKADPTTRELVQTICDLVEEKMPEFEGLLVPNCVYRNGLCTEFEPCGRCDNVRASVIDVGKDMTVHIMVPHKTYANAKRILLTEEGTHFGTLYYPDGGDG